MAGKNAPTIAEDDAYCRPELKGRHVLIVTPDEVRRVADLIAEVSRASCRSAPCSSRTAACVR